MKQRLNNIALIMLASIVFFVGAGVTVFNFCCSNCAESIVSTIDHNSMACAESADAEKADACCDDMTTSSNEMSDCADMQHDQKHCNIERVSADIEHSHVNTQLNIPFIWSLVVYNLAIPNLVKIASDKFEQSYKTPLSIPPRDYLALIRILII